MRLLSVLTLFLFVVLAFPPVACALPSGGLAGFWKTQDEDGVIEFFPCEKGRFCGRFVWLREDSPENPSLDDKNPDEALRQRPLCGLTFMGGFQPEEQPAGRYDQGWIYSPHHGAMFSAYLTLDAPDKMVLHGYVLFPFLGEDQTWRRTVRPTVVCYEKKPLRQRSSLEKSGESRQTAAVSSVP
jgi:uncharacterized protein (DUF2147 family)